MTSWALYQRGRQPHRGAWIATPDVPSWVPLGRLVVPEAALRAAPSIAIPSVRIIQEYVAPGPGAPTITSISPSTGYISAPGMPHIYGTHLDTVTQVTFGAAGSGAVLQIISANEIVVAAPLRTEGQTGAVTVTVTNPSGSSAPFSSFIYDITTAPIRNSFNTLIFDPLAAAVDGTNAYTIGHAEYTALSAGGFPRMRSSTIPPGYTAPEPTPDGGGFYTGPGMCVIGPGKNSAYAFRCAYTGTNTPEWNTCLNNANAPFGSFTYPTVTILDYWGRITVASGASAQTKWVCFATGYAGPNRMELRIYSWPIGSPRYGGAGTTRPTGLTWQYCEAYPTVSDIFGSVIAPFPQDVFNNGFFRFRDVYCPAAVNYDGTTGVLRSWVGSAGDSTDMKVLDLSAAAIGVTPPGGSYVYCTQAELNMMQHATIESLWFGGPNATGSGKHNEDYSDILWYC